MQQANPFVNFIRDLAKAFPKGAVDSVESYEGEGIDNYWIAGDTLRECTGIFEKDDQSEELLGHIWNGYIDLATCLRVKRDRDEAGYRQWLVDELVEHKRKFGIISLNLDSLTISEHADGASVPPEQGRTS